MVNVTVRMKGYFEYRRKLLFFLLFVFFFFQAEDGIRGLVRSRGLGGVYKGQLQALCQLEARSRSRESTSAAAGAT